MIATKISPKLCCDLRSAVLREIADDDAILGPALVATLEARLAAARCRLREARDPVWLPVEGLEMTPAVLRLTRFA